MFDMRHIGFILAAYLFLFDSTFVYPFEVSPSTNRRNRLSSATNFADATEGRKSASERHDSRRSFLSRLHKSISITSILLVGSELNPNVAHATSLQDLLLQINEARTQLEPVPQLIQSEKWDSIRAILITPPLSDCWAKTNKPLLMNYAEAIGNEVPDGDELAALELKEDLLYHLRFLDMAVYNNVFNPIKTEGETGATKELVKSYYEDPIREYKATKKALDELVGLATMKP